MIFFANPMQLFAPEPVLPQGGKKPAILHPMALCESAPLATMISDA
ncbi:hypothetical protein [Paracoccus sp. (in: a-proteobacteria)]